MATRREGMGRPEALELADGIGKLIGRVRRHIWYAVARALEPHDISIFSWQILSHVVREQGVCQRELAALTAQHPAGTSRTLLELERAGLVRRPRDLRDRRRVRVEPTARGARLVERIRPSVVLALDGALVPLALDERRQLMALLGKLPPLD
jgi:DNA-binding MarR family transcriptional regulator